MRAKLPALAVLTVIGLVSFSATAMAATAVTGSNQSDLVDLLRPVYDAFAGGRYMFGASLLVIAGVALTKRYLSDRVTFLRSDAGGSLLALVGATASAFSVALAVPGAAWSFDLLKSSVLVGVAAAGGYAVLKNLIVDPILIPLEAKAPAWSKPLFALVLWIFDKTPAAAQAKAEQTAVAAAVEAVKANPAGGVVTIIAPPTEVK